MNETNYDFAPAKKTFSRIGLALSAIIVVMTVFQIILLTVPALIWGKANWLTTSSWGKWIISFAPLYLIAIPTGLLIMKKLPAHTPKVNKLKIKELIIFLMICYCMTYGGSLIGNALSSLLSGGTAQNPITDYAMDTNPIKILVIVILAPLLEEYVCRKQIIDRTRQYGEKTAVFLSALTFGLLHQNLFQFFYAFGVGLVFAYVYIRTGRVRYTVILHGILNFIGSVITPLVLSLVDLDALTNMDPNASTEQIMNMLPGIMVYLLYAMFLIGMAIAGLILLILKYKQMIWKEADEQLPKGTAVETVYLNIGMVVYILICVSSFILELI